MYTLNHQYIKKLLILKNVDKKQLYKDMGITENSFSLKIHGRTLISIQQGIALSKALRLPIETVFCPTKIQLYNCLYGNPIEFLQVEYKINKYNLRQNYIMSLIKAQNMTLTELKKKMNLGLTSIYDKLGSRTKITMIEAVKFSDIFKMSIDDIFCPTKGTISNILSLNNIIQKDNSLINNKWTFKSIDKSLTIQEFVDSEDLPYDMEYIKETLKDDSEELSDELKITPSFLNYKIDGVLPFTYEEAKNISEFLDKDFDDLFKKA